MQIIRIPESALLAATKPRFWIATQALALACMAVVPASAPDCAQQIQPTYAMLTYGYQGIGGHISTGRTTYSVNVDITAKMVRVIGLDGKPMGIMSTERALLASRELGQDLVEVAANGAPPVCRMMDAGKHKYQVSKRQHRVRSRQRVVQVKDMRFSICIGAEDYRIKVCKCIGILRSGDSVRATVHFRGREMRHQGAGAQLLERIGTDLSPHGIARGNVRREDRHMAVMITPLSSYTVRECQG